MSKHVHRLLTSAYPYAGGRISSSALSKTSSFPSPTAANNSGRLAPFRSQTTGGGGSSTPAPSKPNPNRGKGPITWRNFSVLAVAGAGALSFFYYVKNEKDVAIMKERKRMLGKAAIGGKWQLVDTNGQTRKSEDFLGKWLLIYFGFTHCPDICPDELEKMAGVVDDLEANEMKPAVQPIFITVDPQRDSKEVIDKYVKEFSPKLLGMTGTDEQISTVCKAFRVYFSAGPKDVDNDYIVDHTIIMYLVNPDGEFVDYYGQNRNREQVTTSILMNILKWNKLNSTSWFS